MVFSAAGIPVAFGGSEKKMPRRAAISSAATPKKAVWQKKKNKRQWINLKDRSQRWSHEKKLRDIRARAALKRQRRKEEGIEEDSHPENQNNLQEVAEKEEGRRSWKKQRPYFSSVSCFSERYESLAADPEEFLERLYNPSYKKKKLKGEVEEDSDARQEADAVSDGERESGRKGTAAVHYTVGECVGEKNERNSVSFSKERESDSSLWRKQVTVFSSANEGDVGGSNTRMKKQRAKKRKEQDQQAQHGEDDDSRHGENEEVEQGGEVEVGHSDNDLREEKALSDRRRKSRRLAFYSPQSVATYRAEHLFSEEKEKQEEERKRHVVDFCQTTDKCTVKAFASKKVTQGIVGDASSSAEVAVDECTAGVEGSGSLSNRSVSNGKNRGETRITNKEGKSQRQLPVSVCNRNAGDSRESPRPQPKGLFYPFRNAMKEAARRKAAQEEERRRREEEKQKAEKEKEMCRRKRAKHRRQLVARTSRGQPVMKNVMHLLLDKIRKSL